MKIISIKGTGIELTPAIKTKIRKKIQALAKFTQKMGQAVNIEVEVGKPSKHHNKGDVFYAEINLEIPEKVLRAAKEADDLYKAIDEVHEEVVRQIKKYKEKRRDGARKGARRAKKLTSLNTDAMYSKDAKVAERLKDDEI